MSERPLIGLAAETETIDQNQERQGNHELLFLTAEVEMDGSSAVVTMHTTEGQIDFSVPIELMPAVAAELSEAGALMMRRQLKIPSKGKSAIRDMMRRSMRPVSIMPAIDRATGDCVIVYMFEDQMPYIVRITMEQMAEARANFSIELSKLAH